MDGRMTWRAAWIVGALVLAGCGRTPAPPAPAAPAPAPGDGSGAVIGRGEPVQLERWLVPGRTVIFDFMSAHCPPCRRLGPLLEELARRDPSVVVVKVDIDRPGARSIDWSSPLARQFGLQGIPHLKVYGPDGRLASEGEAAMAGVEDRLRAAGLLSAP